MRVKYLHKLLIYLRQLFSTITFILLACIPFLEIMESILKFLFVLVYNKGSKFLLHDFRTNYYTWNIQVYVGWRHTSKNN